MATLPDEIENVEFVLRDFFRQTKEGWTNDKVMEVMNGAEEKHKKLVISGIKGAEKRYSHPMATPKPPYSKSQPQPQPHIDLDESKSPSVSKRGSGGKNYSADFERFWAVCPRREGKAEAATAFERARKSADVEILIEKMALYANHCKTKQKESRFIKHPSTWLNKGSWDDELDFTEDKPQVSQKPDYFRDTVLSALHANTKGAIYE